MKINIKQAIRVFFQNPSLEMVFIEAIANSLDAKATKIDIDISIDAFDKVETLEVAITDNGEGFTDERYKKFCELLKVEEDSHRGVGRLVYLCYFNEITIDSQFDGKARKFMYNQEFEESDTNNVVDIKGKTNTTKLNFTQCSSERLSSYDVIKPEYLKKRVMEEFYPRLYLMKQDGVSFEINFNLSIKVLKAKQTIGLKSTSIVSSDIPILKEVDVDTSNIAMFEKTTLHYSIRKSESIASSIIITGLCVDTRTYKLPDVTTIENLPIGYELIFLLSSSIFDGKTNPSRQSLTLKENVKKQVAKIFRDEISKIVQEEIPLIKESNQKTKESLKNTYPHLVGYFEEGEIGFISRSKSIEDAQQKFLRDQKVILEASSLTDKEYDKAMEISARTLAEYILYREKIISKLSNITEKEGEDVIHNLILPKGTVLNDSCDLSSIYANNLWLLDDKYMTYTTAMSDKTMNAIVKEITSDDSEKGDNTEPDIAIIFSDNPNNSPESKVDVVIVELKKRGIPLAKTEEVISQLKQRARRLMKYYPNKIQRIWFYGIVEFNNEFLLSLKDDEYTPLYSKDTLYYKENKIYLSTEDVSPYIIGTYILSIDAFINDAKSRNSTFLQLLRSSFSNRKE
ncbi:MAG: ATP-binding protein [Rikenellaceae bacterium]